MSNDFHSDLSGIDIHVPHTWEYADQTAREAATGFTTDDIHKIALQLDDNSLWLLTAVDPTWVGYGGTQSHNSLAGIQGGQASEYYHLTDIQNQQVSSRNLTKAPTGFPYKKEDSSVNFDNATRTYAIEPLATEFVYQIKGITYSKTSQDSVVIDNVTGIHIIYYDGTTLKSVIGWLPGLGADYAYVAIVQWNATDGLEVFFHDERHGSIMDRDTHGWGHFSFGTKYVEGIDLVNVIANGDGSSDSHCQFGITTGRFMDEDVTHFVQAQSAPKQTIKAYRQSTDAQWTRTNLVDNFPIVMSSGTLPAFNENTSGSTWVQTEMTSGKYILSILFGVNDPDINHTLFAFQGQNQYDTATDARDGLHDELVTFLESGMADQEMLPLFAFIIEGNTSFTNSVKARIVKTPIGEDYIDLREKRFITGQSGGGVTHNSLTGRTDPSAHPSTALDTDTSSFNNKLSGSDDTVQKAFDTLDDHTHIPSEVGLGNVDNLQQIPLSQKGASSGVAELDGSGHVPTAQLPDTVTGALYYKGTWNANTNTPTLSNGGGGGNKGDYYVVNVAGTTTIDGISDWEIGDWIVNNGTVWEKIDNTDKVSSVAGKTGAVILNAADITDFDTEVSNNTDVAQNTTDRHTHSNKTQLDLVTDGDHDVRTDNPHSTSIDQVTPTTTKGDIIVENGTNAVRLPVGNNNEALIADSAQTEGVRWADISTFSFPKFQFYGDQFDNPRNADWAINSLARAYKDSNNNAITVRQFDDTTEEGIGFTVKIPTGATNIILGLHSRAETAAASSLSVVPRIYVREFPDNLAVESWSTGTDLTTLIMGTSNEFFQYDSQTIALSSLSLNTGRIAQFELTRNAGSGSDTLVDDWVLFMLGVDFS